MKKPFKACSYCDESWNTREEFLSDVRISMKGYTPIFENPEYGLFYFTHSGSCNATLSLFVHEFVDLYKQTTYPDKKTGSSECRGLCQIKNNLEQCFSNCRFTYIRDLIQIIKAWPKKSS